MHFFICLRAGYFELSLASQVIVYMAKIHIDEK